MYQSIVKQRNKQSQHDESNHHFLSGGKGSIIVETTNEKSTSAMKQNKIKPRDLSSPYSSSFNSNTFQKKKLQSQSVEKSNQKLSKGNTAKPWKKQVSNTNKNPIQEDDNKDLQTTAVSDLRGSQNNLHQRNEKEFKRNTNSPMQQLSSSSKQQQQLASSVEYSTTHIHNISTTTTTTAASRGNSRVGKNTSYKKNNPPPPNYTNNVAGSKSPKYYQSTNPNQTSINPWNINNQRKLNLNQATEDQDAHRDKKYQSTSEYSPENNNQQRGCNRIAATHQIISQKSISSPIEPFSAQKRNRDIQSANYENTNGKVVKGIKPKNPKIQHTMDRTNSSNITTIKKGMSQQNQTISESANKRDSGIPATKSKKPSLHTQVSSNRNRINATSQKPQKVPSSTNEKEAFNKKLNSKIQKKTFERSTNDVNSASETEYFEMSQKFSTIGDPRLFIDHFMGGSAASTIPSPFLKPQNIKNNAPHPKGSLKYPNYKIDQNSPNKQHDSNPYRQPHPEEEIEEKIETESKNSMTNSPRQLKMKITNKDKEIEIDEINQLDYIECLDEEDQQERVTQDFKNDYTMSNIPQLNPITMSKIMQKDNQEGHDGDDEDNSGDYTDYEKQKKINSTGLSFTKPNLIIKRNESYISDLQKTQDKIFQKYSNPTYNNNNCQHQNNNPNHNFTTQQEEQDIDHSYLHQIKNQQIDEQEEFNQTQTRFFKEQITHMMASNLRPFTPPFQQVYKMNSSNLRKQESLSSNNSSIHHCINQTESIVELNSNQKLTKSKIQNNQNYPAKHDQYIHQNKSSISSQKGDFELEVMYDDILNCYYDPKTNQYYELKA